MADVKTEKRKEDEKNLSLYGLNTKDLQMMLDNGHTRKEIQGMDKGQKLALALVYKRQAAAKSQAKAKAELERMREEKRLAEKQKREAEKELKKLEDTEKVIIALAGIPTPDEDRANRVKAIDAYFDLLNLVPYEEKDKDGQMVKKPFSALYNKVRPVTKLFEFVRAAAFYGSNRNIIGIDVHNLRGMIEKRLEEQDALKEEARKKLEALGQDVLLKEDTKEDAGEEVDESANEDANNDTNSIEENSVADKTHTEVVDDSDADATAEDETTGVDNPVAEEEYGQ